MTATVHAPAATPRLPPVAVVAGLDVLTSTERAAEHVLNEVVAAAHAAGAELITTATHRVQVFETAHVAMSISMTCTLDHSRLLELLAQPFSGDGAAGAVWAGDLGVGLPALQTAARQAATAHQDRSSGRVVHFPGRDAVPSTATVQQVLETAVDQVQQLGGGDLALDAIVNTRDFLRPRWQDGQLVLHVQAAVGGTWVPFETPNPTPCCALHT